MHVMENTSCSDLIAKGANAYDRTNGVALVTDYMILEYVCEENKTGKIYITFKHQSYENIFVACVHF